jgi:hypothetical protein
MGFGRQRLNVRQPVAMEGNLVKIGFHLTPFWSPTDRSPTHDVAENVATLDHISHGRVVLGISIGYREQELRSAGLTRKDRVPKLEESRFDEDALVWAGDDLSRQVHAG